MHKVLALLLAMGFVGSAMVVQRGAAASQAQDAQTANDAAYRDGLYVGRLAHAAHRQTAAPIGRWSAEKDRASFAAGFKQGFSE